MFLTGLQDHQTFRHLTSHLFHSKLNSTDLMSIVIRENVFQGNVCEEMVYEGNWFGPRRNGHMGKCTQPKIS
jgi:hypothetical protein